MFNESVIQDWKILRWGRFTASEIYNLVTKGNGTTFSAGGLTYIKKIAQQAYTVYNEDESVETFAMKLGKAREPQAFAHFKRLLDFGGLEYYGGDNPIFEPYEPFKADSGASPDSLAWIDQKLVSFGSEFKCPNSATHWEYLKIKDQTDLRKVSEQFYGQCQFSMMVFNCELWHWCSYNEYYPFKDRMLIVEVKPDKQYQENLKIRLGMAVNMKYELIEEMKNR